MSIYRTLDYLPLWGFFAATVCVVLISIEVGYRLSQFRLRRSTNELEAPVGAIVASALGLLGLVLAFTFGLAAARFDARRQTVVEEANAIGTTYLRAGLLPDDGGAKIRRLLAEYTLERLEVVRTGDTARLLQRSGELHLALWREAEAIGKQHADLIVVGLFIQSLNETIDVHSKRVLVGLQSRLPDALWATLFLVTLLTMAGVGYHEGLAKSRRSPAILVLALTFAAIISLVADLDRPREGLLMVSQQAMLDLRQMMNDLP